MGKAYSLDLRERVVEAIEKGQSRRTTTAQFGIGISTAINWMRRKAETGSPASKKVGGNKPRKIRDEHREWLIVRCAKEPFTLRGLVAELAGRGLKVDYRSVWEFVHGEKLSYKKNTIRQGTGSSRCRAKTHPVEGAATER